MHCRRCAAIPRRSCNVSLARHGVVVLAAGSSRRLGTAKQLLQRDGETLVHRAARLALSTTPRDAVIVLGHAATDIAAAVRDLSLRSVVCTDHAHGLGASLAAGLAALHGDCAGALVVLCDQPALEADHLQALLTTWQRSPAYAVASTYAGVRGVPALLPRTWFSRIGGDGDRGAREWLRAESDGVLAVSCEALASDIDTLADLGTDR